MKTIADNLEDALIANRSPTKEEITKVRVMEEALERIADGQYGGPYPLPCEIAAAALTTGTRHE